jgi:hypothetical protein
LRMVLARIYSVYGISNPDKLGGISAASGSLAT